MGKLSFIGQDFRSFPRQQLTVNLVRDTSLVIQTRIILKEQHKFVLWDSKWALLKAHCNLYVMHIYAFVCICTFLIWGLIMFFSLLHVQEKKTTKQNQGNYFFFRKRTTKISNIFVCLVYGIDILQKRVISPSILKFSKNINFFLAKHKSW